MNCADYQRRLAADPARTGEACESHRVQCTDCAALTERARAFEQRLGKALAIAPPSDFAQALLGTLRQQPDAAVQTLRLRQIPRARWMPPVAIAASVLVAVFAGLGTWSLQSAHAMPEMAAQHVMGEEAAALHKTTPISIADVVAGFRSRHLALHELPDGDITYVHDCVVGGFPGVHITVRRNHEVVTVLYLLGTHRKAGNFQSDGMHVRMVPDARGTLIFLARNSAPFDAVEKAWHPVIDSAVTIPAGAS